MKRDTNDHPLFIGPIFVHGNSDSATFHTYFTRLAAELCGCPSSRILGLDEEKALRKAMEMAFPDSEQIVCTWHLKNNSSDHLRDKVGIPSKQRKKIVQSVYGPQRITCADDEITFDHQVQQVTDIRQT